ncbi:ubiquitin-like-conjugating enzyme ATG10, partial [Paragonimus westermani]
CCTVNLSGFFNRESIVGHLSSYDFTTGVRQLLPLLRSLASTTDDWSIEEFRDPSSTELVCRKNVHFRDIASSEFELGTDAPISLEYRVLYSSAFEVPILLIRDQNSAGGSLSTNNFLAFLSAYTTALYYSSTPLLLGLSQIEHPHLGIPYYQFHPCRTAQLMRETLSVPFSCNFSHAVRYLLLWLSLVCSPLGVDIPKGLVLCAQRLEL